VLAVVAAYNADPDCHGILVQLPMPAGPCTPYPSQFQPHKLQGLPSQLPDRPHT